MGVDKMGVDKMGVDEMGVKRSENEARKTCIDLIHELVNVRLRHSLPDGKLQKECPFLSLFYSRIAVNDGKGRRLQ